MADALRRRLGGRRPHPRWGGGPIACTFAALSVGDYALGPSIVHAADGNVWKGFANVGLRAAMPTMGYVIANALGGGIGDRVFGAFAGGAGAIAADASALA